MVLMPVAAFCDELVKLAAKVPFLHGTSQRLERLLPGVGKTILKTDPNPRAVYTMMKNRDKLRSAERFAREAHRARGGEAVVAMGKMDTKAGWRPTQLTEWGKQHIGSLEDAHGLIDELDRGATGARRGEIWEHLQRGTGAWRNLDLRAELPVAKNQPARTVETLRKAAAG